MMTPDEQNATKASESSTAQTLSPGPNNSAPGCSAAEPRSIARPARQKTLHLSTSRADLTGSVKLRSARQVTTTAPLAARDDDDRMRQAPGKQS